MRPISGNRELGFTTNTDGSYTFFARGVDRLTIPITTRGNYFISAPVLSLKGLAFEGADATWESFKDGITNYVNSNQGATTRNPTQIYRPNWSVVKDVRDGIKPLSTLSNDCN